MPRLSPEQLTARRHAMGSTDVVEVCGLSPFAGAGPMRVYLAKTTERVDDDGTPEMDYGHRIEPVLLQWYEEIYGACLPGGHVPCAGEPWLFATLDASVIGESRIVDAKNVGSPALYRHWDTSSPDGVPAYVRAQVTIGMLCHGARDADVIASIGGRPPHVWRVAYDEELANMLIAGGRRFWDLVQAGTPPPLDATASTKEYLRAKYPAPRERVIVELGDDELDVDQLGVERIEAARVEKRMAIEKARLDAEILSRVGDREGVRGSGWQMTWKLDKNQKRSQRFTATGGGDE